MYDFWKRMLANAALAVQDPASRNLHCSSIAISLRIMCKQGATDDPSQTEHQLSAVCKRCTQITATFIQFALQDRPRGSECRTHVLISHLLNHSTLHPRAEDLKILTVEQVPHDLTRQHIGRAFPRHVRSRVTVQSRDVVLRLVCSSMYPTPPMAS